VFWGIPGIRVYCKDPQDPLKCDVMMPGSTTMFIGKACSPSVVIDGLLLHRGGSGVSYDLNEELRPFNLEAIEIYPHSSGVPVQWRTSACGAIVAWSRR
jgi:hypothetical protein